MVNISNIGSLLTKWGNPTFDSLVKDRIWVALNVFVLLSGLVAVVLIIYSGYLFMTSAGDPEKIQAAQKTITAAIVGMIIVFLARMIIGFVLGLIGGNVVTELLQLGILSSLS